MKKKYFYLGLIIFYFLITLVPNKLVYFSAYFISTFFFYLATKNIRVSLLYSLILSLFSDVGLASSWFLMEPKELNLGSGYMITPTTILLFLLLVFSFTKKPKSFHVADIFVLFLFLWSVINFLLFPYSNVLYGILSLGEIVLLYYFLRIHLTKNLFVSVGYLFISMLFFQTFLGTLQLFLRRPVGLLIEAVTFANPFGVTASENENLFRLTGTFGHPNFFASFLLISLPFLFFSPVKNKLFTILKFLALTALFFTYSRAAWGIILFLFILWLASQKNILLKIISRASCPLQPGQ